MGLLKERKDISVKDLWNVEALYLNFDAWEKEYVEWSNPVKWERFLSFQGKLLQGAESVKQCLDAYFLLNRHLGKLYTYAHLRHDEDVSEKQAKEAYEKALFALFGFGEKSSWLRPEFLDQEESYLQKCIEELPEYAIFLKALLRLKPHTLSQDQERILSLAAQSLEGPRKTFSSFNNADLKFGAIEDGSKGKHELTLGSYSKYLSSTDRVLRQNAFFSIHNRYMEYENTLCDLLGTQVQTHLFEAKARNYSSCLEAALYPYQIDTAVYHNLIKSVKERLPSLHRYVALRKKLLNVDAVHVYDLYVPLIVDQDESIPYEDAEKAVIDASEFLGKSYKEALEKGLKVDRWVDRFQNVRKRSGAYSSGCYDSMPYILMNYNGTLRDMMTLCHEAGHSMHSLHSQMHQPYPYADYPIFVAEVASTFNEEVLTRHLLKAEKDPMRSAYLINQKIEDIRATLFRQTLFAEFELFIHEKAEQGVPLTPDLLKQEYRRLNQEYYGPDLVLDEALDIEWARIPHFYSNFYVYQYATGISAALYLVNHIEKEGEKAKEAYLKFLSSGSSAYPIDLLQIAGVDMHKSVAIHEAIDYFDSLLNKFEGFLRKS